MCNRAYLAETVELLILDVIIIEADLLLVPVVNGLQLLSHEELADLLIIYLDVLPPIGLPYFEDEVIILEAETVLLRGYVIDAIKMFVLDADY